MKRDHPFGYDISPKRPSLVAGVSSLLSDGGAVSEILLTSIVPQQDPRLTFHQKKLTNSPNITRSERIGELSIIIIIRYDSLPPGHLAPISRCLGMCFSTLHIRGIHASCCNNPTIGSYNNCHLRPNGIQCGNQRWYGLVYK